MVLTPVLKTTSGETVTLPPINLEGEKTKGGNQVIGYKTGGSFTYNHLRL